MNKLVIQGYFPNGIPSSSVQAGGRVSSPPLQPAGSAREVIPIPTNRLHLDRRPGEKLPSAVQQKMESFFKTDFSDVRVRVGPQPASIGALAFTCGTNIYFAPGRYNPHTPSGQQLLGHELTHVMQQRSGRVQAARVQGMAVVRDRALEAEADRLGRQAAFFQMKSSGSGSSFAIAQNVLQASKGQKRGATASSSDSVEPRRKSARVSRPEFSQAVKDLCFLKGNSWVKGPNVPDGSYKPASPTEAGGCDSKVTIGPGLDVDRQIGSKTIADNPPAITNAQKWDREVHNGKNGKYGFISGHLLNEELGGNGLIPENVTILTSTANKNHSKKFEEPVKKCVRDLRSAYENLYKEDTSITPDKLKTYEVGIKVEVKTVKKNWANEKIADSRNVTSKEKCNFACITTGLNCSATLHDPNGYSGKNDKFGEALVAIKAKLENLKSVNIQNLP